MRHSEVHLSPPRTGTAYEASASQDTAPIFECVRDYLDRSNALFCSPGHIGGRALPEEFSRRIAEFDATFQAEPQKYRTADGPLHIAEELLAEAYEVDRSFMLAGGSTAGNIASLLALLRPGDDVLVPRNVHKSTVAGLIHAGAVPIWMRPDWDARFGIAHGISVAEIERVLCQHPSARAIVCVGATYFGATPDVSEIAAFAERHGLPLIVDAAHGPHFRFHPQLPVAAENAGAAVVVQSMHKILPALSAGAILHIRKDVVTEFRIRQALQVIETTSPNLAIFASIDLVRRLMALEGEALLEQALVLARHAREALACIPGVTVLAQGDCLGPRSGFRQLDELKLTINVCRLHVEDRAIWEHFVRRHRVQPEFVESGNILCQLTVGTTASDVDRLIAAVNDLARLQSFRRVRDEPDNDRTKRALRAMPAVALTPREAFYAPSRDIELETSVGAVSADVVTPYPPGVPVLMPGERITADIVEFLAELRSARHRVSAADPSLIYLRIVR
jgi:arginine/lysine/ornithine decarboxylase